MGISRSENMSRIRGSDTAPERLLGDALAARGLDFAHHARTPAGKPDLVFVEEQVAVFIDGCFWHGCPEHYVRPRSRTEFWAAKLQENVERDTRQVLALEASGWQALRFWEHAIFTDLEAVCDRVEAAVRGDALGGEGEWRVLLVEPLDEGGTQERRTEVMLHDHSIRRVIEQKRHTRKWTRPKAQEG